MSIHSSLKRNKGAGQASSVLKRLQKILLLMKDGKWQEGDAVYGLPKVKIVKYKIKKKAKEIDDTKEGDDKTKADTAPAEK